MFHKNKKSLPNFSGAKILFLVGIFPVVVNLDNVIVIFERFDKFGGNLGTTGCVSFMFEEKGVIVIENDGKIDEDQLMEDALEAGAADFASEDGAFEISTETDDLNAVREALEAKGYVIASADNDKIPSSYVTLTGEDDIKNMSKLIEALEDNDDVIEVYHNWENPDEE